MGSSVTLKGLSWTWLDHPWLRVSINTEQCALCQTRVPYGLRHSRLNLPEVPLSRRLSFFNRPRYHPFNRALNALGSRYFMFLFHSPSRGFFHRSLAVLVHYRVTLGVLSAYEVGPFADSIGISRCRPTSRDIQLGSLNCRLTGLSPPLVASFNASSSR